MTNEASTARHKGRNLTSGIRNTGSDETHKDISQESTCWASKSNDLTRAQKETRSLWICISAPIETRIKERTYNHACDGNHVDVPRFQIPFDLLSLSTVRTVRSLDITARGMFFIPGERHYDSALNKILRIRREERM